MNGLQMNMILARFTILEEKLNLLIKKSGAMVDEMAIEETPATDKDDGPADNIADPVKGFNPDVKGPDDPANKANMKTGQEEAVDKHYKQFPQERDELSNKNDDKTIY